MRKLKIRETFLGIAAIATLTAAGVDAATVNQITEDVSTTTTYTVSSTDLINGLTPADGSSLGTWKGTESTNAEPAVLTDGEYGPLGGGDNVWKPTTFTISNSTGTPPNPTVLIYNLDLTSAPQGYDITGIATYSAWADQNRNQQHYEVLYSTVSDPTTFISLGTFHSTKGVGAPANRSVVWDISDLSNVAAIKFDFSGTQGFNYTGYREIDVLGGAAIPEPASLSILALGALGLLARRRKQR